MWKSTELHVTPGFWGMLVLAALWGAIEVMPLVLAAAVCHELGHLAVLRLFGIPVKEINLTAMGAVIVAPGQERLSYGRELAAVLAGAGVNFLLAILFARYLFFAGYTIYLSAASTTQFWHNFSEYWAGLFCLLGHMFPCMFHFKGGKGILSGGTIAIMIDWRVALVVWGGFLILAVLTKYVSLGSIWAGASFPFATYFVYHDLTLTLFGLLLGGLVVFMHRGNIQRLLHGTENKFSLHHRKN